MNRIISKNLKTLRKKHNLTQSKLCEELYKQGYLVLRNTYTNYESGKRTVLYEVLVEIAKYYNVSTDYIFEIKK